jgi:hypothetical protein
MTGSGGKESYIGRAVKINLTGRYAYNPLKIEELFSKPL